MKFNDCYEIPALARSATQDDGKLRGNYAWRKLARQYHPDPGKDPDAEFRSMKP